MGHIANLRKHMIIIILIKRRKIHYLLYGNKIVFHLNKLESPSPKDVLCQIWLKLAQWFWRRFYNFVNVYSLFQKYLPLKRERSSIEQT